jgi:uncharacterized protein (DUF58 family)
VTAATLPAGRLRAGFERWLHTRHRRSDTLLLTQRNIYILPTRAGVMFGLTVLLLLLASINYQLNLGYVLTFLLAGSAIVSMHLTHATLRGLTLHLTPPAPPHAGDAAILDAVLTSPGSARFGIGLKIRAAADSSIVWTDVPGGGQAAAQLSFATTQRGLHDVPTLGIATRFPLGLFRAWTVWRPAAQVLVYPKAERGAPPLPAAPAGGQGPARRADNGSTEGVRVYRRGDPLNRIAWKKAATALQVGGELVSRDAEARRRSEIWLDWAASGTLDAEARLERLAAWVLSAQQAGCDYGLRLPGVTIAPDEGEMQQRRCLEALALWH